MDSRAAISISLLVILISFVPTSSAALQNSTLDSQGNYDNPSLGISFQAPAGWTVSEPKKYQPDAPDVAIIAPYSSGFTASISLSIEKANGTSLDDYVKNKTDQLTNDQANVAFLSEQDDTIGAAAAKTLSFEENFTSQDGNNTIKFKQSIALANDEFYTITYANDLKNFDADLTNYGQLLGSIKFVNNTASFPFDYVTIGIVGIALALGVIITIKRKKKLS
ncbi:MAG: hypothetical protein KGH88_02425 [Thaumarchaeota archaeon]|nr:hypothetical protein [Nitrososphaerota archaeon]